MPASPPEVEYALTPLGASLSSVVAEIRAWAYAHITGIEAAPRDFDRRTDRQE